MVAFGKELLGKRCVAFQPYYMNYKRLKNWIKEMESNIASPTQGDALQRSSKFLGARSAFFEELQSSLVRVNGFYKAQQKRVQVEVEALRLRDMDVADRRKESAELEESCKIITEFALVNKDGFRKITKKYDKKIGELLSHNGQQKLEEGQNATLQDYMLENLPHYDFSQADEHLQRIMMAVEDWVSHGPGHSDNAQLSKIELQATPEMRRRTLHFPLLHDERPLPRWKIWLTWLRHQLCSSLGYLFVTTASVALAIISPSEILNLKSYFVIWVTGMSLILLVKRHPADGVLMGATLLLNISRILTLEQAWSAFSNDVVLSVGGLGVLATVVGHTGIIDTVFQKVVGKPKTLPMAMLRLALPAICMNVGVSNTCVMSCLLPVIEKWSLEIGHHKALFLMPISFLLLISGVFAIFSTSTNLVVQGQLRLNNREPFDMFALAPAVTACTAASLVYLIVVPPFVLRRFKDTASDDESGSKVRLQRGINRFNARVQVMGQALAGQTLSSSGLLEILQGGLSDICSCERYGTMQQVYQDFILAMDDCLDIRTSADSLHKLQREPGLLLMTRDGSDTSGLEEKKDLYQVVLDQQSPLVGHPLEGAKKRATYGCSIVAHRPFAPFDAEDEAMQRVGTGFSSDVVVQRGDHIIFHAPHEFHNIWSDSGDFVFVRPIGNVGRDDSDLPSYAPSLSGCILLSMIVIVATSTLPLVEAVFLAIAAMILSGCTTLDAVVKATKLRTLMVIVGAFGVGTAMGSEHVAAEIANILLFLLSPFGTLGLLIAIFGATVALGVVFHGTAVVVLMYPVCQHVADSEGIPLHCVASVLCIAASCQFLSPISYQTNLMAYHAGGGYEFSDFTKTGVGLVFVVALVSLPMCVYLFP